MNKPTVKDRIRVMDLMRFEKVDGENVLKNWFTVMVEWAKIGTGLSEDELFEKYDEAKIIEMGSKTSELVNFKKA